MKLFNLNRVHFYQRGCRSKALPQGQATVATMDLLVTALVTWYSPLVVRVIRQNARICIIAYQYLARAQKICNLILSRLESTSYAHVSLLQLEPFSFFRELLGSLLLIGQVDLHIYISLVNPTVNLSVLNKGCSHHCFMWVAAV